MEVMALAPNAEVTAYPWKEQEDVRAKTINQVRAFLQAHQPAITARGDGQAVGPHDRTAGTISVAHPKNSRDCP